MNAITAEDIAFYEAKMGAADESLAPLIASGFVSSDLGVAIVRADRRFRMASHVAKLDAGLPRIKAVLAILAKAEADAAAAEVEKLSSKGGDAIPS